jgi:hypothetical protein
METGMKKEIMNRSTTLVVGALALAVMLAASPAVGAYYALLVGIADYPGTVNDLSYCDDDANDMAAALTQRPNWSSGNITMLLNSQATSGQIYSALMALNARMSSSDTLVLFYSGHGITTSDIAPIDEADGVDECLYVYDTTIRDDELSAWLGNLRADQIIVLLDSCFSGGSIKARSKGLKTLASKGIVRAGDGLTKDITGLPGVVALTACRDDELSWEFGFLRNGLFTFLTTHLMDRFVDPDSDGLLSAEEIYSGLGRWESFYNLLNSHPQVYDNYPAGNPTAGELTLIVK